MKRIAKLRERLARRRTERADRTAEQEQLRRELDAQDHSLGAATHGPPPNVTGIGSGF